MTPTLILDQTTVSLHSPWSTITIKVKFNSNINAKNCLYRDILQDPFVKFYFSCMTECNCSHQNLFNRFTHVLCQWIKSTSYLSFNTLNINVIMFVRHDHINAIATCNDKKFIFKQYDMFKATLAYWQNKPYTCSRNRRSYITYIFHVLLNLLKEFGKIRCEAYRFSPMSLINSIIQEHECKILFIIWH